MGEIRRGKRCAGLTLPSPPTPHSPAPTPPPRVAITARRRRGSLLLSAALAPEAAAAAAAPPASTPLESHPDLLTGTLPNGLRYVVLPNATPPGRFEAHLEIHAGSVDERPDQQGLAHVVEHVTFLGSRRREGLLGTGARSNAYTDFHHTVFHVHAPAVNGALPGAPPMLPQVLAALAEVAFDPELLPARLEKERAAVLAEAQMMNTIEYRVDCQLLKWLHGENALGERFPIGLPDQVRGWQRADLLEFWSTWYWPGNATLYLVGEWGGNTADAAAAVETAFGSVPAGRHAAAADAAPPVTAGRQPTANQLVAAATGDVKQRHPVRPPVEHVYGCGPLPTGVAAPPRARARPRLSPPPPPTVHALRLLQTARARGGHPGRRRPRLHCAPAAVGVAV